MERFFGRGLRDNGVRGNRLRGNGMLGVLALGVVGLLAVVMFSGAMRPPSQQLDYSSGREPVAGFEPVAGGGIGAGGSQAVQDVYVTALPSGVYDNPVTRVKAGVPVRLHFTAKPGAGCGSVLVMRDFGVTLISRGGKEQVAEFTPPAGRFEYACSMRMFRGVLIAE
ncbi:MAG: hypothetical protein AABW54_01230 [Candidatus Micrarchaeota archaeon]